MEFLSKNKPAIIFYLFAATAVSFLLSLALMQLFVALIILFWLFDKDRFRTLDLFSLFFAFYILVRIISIFTSEYTELSYSALYKEALFYLGFFGFAHFFKKFDSVKKEQIIKVFVYTAALVAIIGITLFALNIKHRAQSYMAGYGTFSTYLLVAFALFFYDNPGKESRKLLLKITTGALILTGIVLALSRTDIGIAAMIIVAALLFRKMKFSTIAAIVVLTGVFCLGAFSLNSSELNVRVNQPATLSDRDVLWKTAYQISGEHKILGFGPRTFDKVFTHRDMLGDKGIGGWHNDFIAVYIESGAAGLIAFLLFILFLFKQNLTGYFKNRLDESKGRILWILMAAISASVLSACFSGFITNPILSVIFAFTTAMLSSEIYPLKEKL